MTLKPYKLDKYAHDLVLKYRDKNVLNEMLFTFLWVKVLQEVFFILQEAV